MGVERNESQPLRPEFRSIIPHRALQSRVTALVALDVSMLDMVEHEEIAEEKWCDITISNVSEYDNLLSC